MKINLIQFFIATYIIYSKVELLKQLPTVTYPNV